MRIKINIQIFAAIAIFTLAKQIQIYTYLMLFALIHELAHMMAGIMLKLRPKALEIQAFGIGIIFDTFENTEKNKIIIALAGPLINIIIAIIFSYIQIKSKDLIINCNIILALFNLIPIYPLDGGRILKSIIKMNDKTKKTEEIMNKISNVLMIIMSILSSILILIYKNIGLFVIIIYLWVIVMKENKRYILRKRIDKIINEK